MKREYRRKSLSWKIMLLFIAIALILDIAITAISSSVYKNKLIGEHERICRGVSETVAASVNGNRVKEWIAGENKDEYFSNGEKFANIMTSFSNIKSIRVCKMGGTGMQIIYNYSTENAEKFTVGQSCKYDSYLEEKRDALTEGEKINVIMSRKDNEDIMVSLSGIKDKTNKVVCYAICEISTENIQTMSIDFAKKTFLAVGIVSLILALLMSLYVNRTIISPLGKIDNKLRVFAGDANAGEETSENLKKIKFKSKDEISEMHDGFIKLIDEVSMKNNEIKEFDAEIIKRMNELLKEE